MYGRGPETVRGAPLVDLADHVEVDQDRDPLAKHHVARLQVPVEVALPVQVVDRRAHVHRRADRVRHVQPPLRQRLQHVEQRGAGEVLEQDEGPVGGDAAAVELDDVRVPQLLEHPLLAAEGGGDAAVLQVVGRHQLPGQRAPVLRAPDLVELRGAAPGEVADHGELADAVADGEGEVRPRLLPGVIPVPCRRQPLIPRARDPGIGHSPHRSLVGKQETAADWPCNPHTRIHPRRGEGRGRNQRDGPG
jgi:hypothetical protein